MLMVSRQHRLSLAGSSRGDTKGVRAVLRILEGREVPLTAPELFVQLRTSGSTVGLATIYRALRTLREQGRLHDFHAGTGNAFRACEPEPHHHLICTRCGRVQEVPDASSQSTWLPAIDHEGVAAADYRVEVRGVCRRCWSNGPA